MFEYLPAIKPLLLPVSFLNGMGNAAPSDGLDRNHLLHSPLVKWQ